MSQATLDYQPGSLIGGRYEVRRTLRGGMAHLFVCTDRDPSLNIDQLVEAIGALYRGDLAPPTEITEVVLKTPVVDTNDPADTDAIETAFVREAQMWMQLGFGFATYFVGLLAVQRFDGRPFLVMPYFPCGNLREKMRGQQFSLMERVSVLTQILVGMKAVNSFGIIHRDLKPENLLFDEAGRIKITDLGIAQTEQRSKTDLSTAGTLPYMAPEQLLGRRTDARSDQWAWAAIAIELIAGNHPFLAQTPEEIAQRIISGRAPGLPEVRASLGRTAAGVIGRCLQKKPEDRFAGWADLMQAWDAVVRLPSSPILRRDRRIALDDVKLNAAWTREFRGREACDGAVLTMSFAWLRGYKDARSLYSLGEYRKALELLSDLLGSPHEQDSPLGSYCAGTVKGGFSHFEDDPESPQRKILRPGRGLILAALDLLLQSYVAVLTDEPDCETTGRDAEYLTRHLYDSHVSLEALILVKCAQVWTLVGQTTQAEQLLRWLVDVCPEDRTAWYSLYFLLNPKERQEEARGVMEAFVAILTDSGAAKDWLVATEMAWGLRDWARVVKYAERSLSVQECARSPEALFFLTAGQLNSGQRDKACRSFEELSRTAPQSPRVRQLARHFGGAERPAA